MQSLKLNWFIKPSHLHNTNTRTFVYTLFSPLSSLTKTPNPLFVDYLIRALNFSEIESLKLATRFCYVKTLEKPQALVDYFRNLGFSLTQIQSSVRGCPQLLFADIDNTLKPKIELFRQLGFSDSHLGEFFSRNYGIFTRKVDTLVVSIELLKKILGNDENNEALLKILQRGCWLLKVDINSRLLPNTRYFESCGIDGDGLAMLLKKAPRLFTEREDKLRNLFCRVSQMGFHCDANPRMFVRALIAIQSCGVETIERKFEAFKSFGFSKDEYMEMVRKLPTLLNISMKKSIVGLDFYLNIVKLRKEELIRDPVVLSLSMENRVMPRYRVLQLIKSKQLMEREPSLTYLAKLSEDDFLERFMVAFRPHLEELLLAYEGRTFIQSSQQENQMQDLKVNKQAKPTKSNAVLSPQLL